MISIDKLKSVTRIVTHANCPDGIASALILYDVLPQAEIVFAQYGTKEYMLLAPEEDSMCAHGTYLFCDIVPYVERDKQGNMTDFGFLGAQRWVDSGAIVLDHHKGAADLVAMFGENGVFADEKERPGVSGALLAYENAWCRLDRDWKELHGEYVRSFAEVAGVRDLAASRFSMAASV